MAQLFKLFRSKKGDISITTIIVAVIALVVLVVLILIFTGKIRLFGEGVDSCAQRGGTCLSPRSTDDLRCPLDSSGKEVYATYKNTECEKNGRVCCAGILT